jgi:hypothetical protein
MKQLNHIALAALFLLAGAASGSWAVNPGDGNPVKGEDGTVVILPPQHGAVLLPEISSVTARSILEIYLAISLIDGAGKPALPLETVLWREGAWKNRKANVLSKVLFPLKDINYPKDTSYRYKLEYTVAYRKKTMKDTALVYLPLLSGVNFWLPAAFPFDFVSLDADGLKWAADSDDSGLRNVIWKFKANTGGKFKQEAGSLSAKEPQASLVVSKEDALTLDITFNCALNKRMAQVKWTDNGKDLRKLPSGLNIVLTQPDCPK